MKNTTHLKKSLPAGTTLQHPFSSFQSAIDRAIDDFYHFFDMARYPEENFKSLNICPAIDVVEDENSFKIEFELPGVDENQIKVFIDGNLLTITAEKNISRKDEGRNYMLREIKYGKYERKFILPDYVDPDKAQASFKKGMMWVTIPKKEGAQTSRKELTIEKA